MLQSYGQTVGFWAVKLVWMASRLQALRFIRTQSSSQSNMPPILCTLETRHAPRGWFQALAPENVACMSMT